MVFNTIVQAAHASAAAAPPRTVSAAAGESSIPIYPTSGSGIDTFIWTHLEASAEAATSLNGVLTQSSKRSCPLSDGALDAQTQSSLNAFLARLQMPRPADPGARVGTLLRASSQGSDGDSSLEAAIASVLRPNYPIAAPGCRFVPLEIIGTFNEMIGNYSIEPRYGDEANSPETLTLTAMSPTEGSISCVYKRTANDGGPKIGWRGAGPSLGDEGGNLCAVSDLFQSDVDTVAEAMLAAYVANQAELQPCEPGETASDDDRDGNGLDDEWEREQNNEGSGARLMPPNCSGGTGSV